MAATRPDFQLHDQTRERVPTQDARQAVTLGHMRYVLGISLTLCVIAGVAFAIFVLLH